MNWQISAPSIDAYEAQRDTLIDEVNRNLQGAPKLRALLGGNPLDMMRGNHAHHHRFMVTVLRLDAWPMLERTAPVIYEIYLAQGFLPDYFLAEFEAWKRALDKYLNPVHAAELRTIYEWFEGRHKGHVEAAQVQTGCNAPVHVAEAWRDRFETLLGHLTQGDTQAVISMAESSITSPEALVDLYFDVLGPALVEVGARWARGELSVAHEHLASGVVNRAVAYWYHHVLTAKKTRGKAVVTSGANEFHAIGAAMFGDALAIDGWQVINLGANTPIEDLTTLVSEYEPELLVISVTMSFNLLKARDAIARVRALPRGGDCRVMVGGQAFATMPELWKTIGADVFAAHGHAGLIAARR